MKYFTMDRIKQASRHLENFHSGWVIVLFVLAANGVNSKSFTDLNAVHGTNSFLDRYFSGALIGLTDYGAANALRPRFKEIASTFRKYLSPNDYAFNQNTKLWANAYSSRGYREMINRGEIEIQGSAFKLTDKFQPVFEEKLPETFRFEEFLVWLYAFSGVPDDISSWSALYSHLLSDLKVPGGSFASEFGSRFRIDPAGSNSLAGRFFDGSSLKRRLPSPTVAEPGLQSSYLCVHSPAGRSGTGPVSFCKSGEWRTGISCSMARLEQARRCTRTKSQRS